ncbi:MAG: HPr family phosphocarrier protein [Deltaproteobacteria bacterium]|jgi:phosphocarrier protein HPr|nr:MAG: HPr family phosphocarrier protein [Deltaproteobacteria bacterium]RLC18279.1 MAG: HPr family phosphocarrier protein [Deltaproteobacteria bacterium]
MRETGQAFSKDVTVVNDLGLHARSAAKIAEIARDAVSKIWLQKNEERVDAGSILDILTLACGKGSKLTIVINDRSDMKTLNRIVELVKNGFGE